MRDEHKGAVFFDEDTPPPNDNATKAAYRELRLWKQGYLAAITGNQGRYTDPLEVAADFVRGVNAKRAELLAAAQ